MERTPFRKAEFPKRPWYSFTYSHIHSFLQQVFAECLLCVSTVLWRYSSDQGRRPCAPGAYILGADDTQEGSQLSVRKSGVQAPSCTRVPAAPFTWSPWGSGRSSRPPACGTYLPREQAGQMPGLCAFHSQIPPGSGISINPKNHIHSLILVWRYDSYFLWYNIRSTQQMKEKMNPTPPTEINWSRDRQQWNFFSMLINRKGVWVSKINWFPCCSRI